MLHRFRVRRLCFLSSHVRLHTLHLVLKELSHARISPPQFDT